MKKVLAFLLCFVVLAKSGYAEPLLKFQKGQKAVYTIHQKASGGVTLSEAQSTVSMDSVLGFRLEVLSVDPLTGSYPIEVELQVDRLRFEDRITIPFGGKKICYDSARKKNNPLLKKTIDLLMKKPLRFIVNEDFEVVETTGRLEKFEDAYADVTDFIMFGGSEFGYRMILGQIFQLAGKEKGEKSYSVAAYPLVPWEDDSISPSSEGYKIADKSHYQIDQENSTSLLGSWSGRARVTCRYTGLKDHISLNGTVIWSKENPLLQTRDVTFKLKQDGDESDRMHSHATVHQQWTSHAF